MALIEFLAGESANINNLAGSGLGFYGTTFGNSVAVGEYQGTTWITNAAGTAQGNQCDNIQWKHQASGAINGAAATGLLWIPNSLASLNIRFTHSVAVQVQNTLLRIYDRSDITRAASGVTTKVAELRHPSDSQLVEGSGDAVWTHFSGGALSHNQTKTLSLSPGQSGHYAGNGSGSTHSSTHHDWFLALSASPDSIGSKAQYGLYVSLEYL